MREDNGWKIVHAHYSPLPEP
ncbi:hypothetical protein [Megasphaera stantonii]